MLVFNDLEWIRDTDKDKTILVKTLSQERRASGDALCVRFSVLHDLLRQLN